MMDRYDEYQAMNNAGIDTSGRMNKLKAYMALYSSSGMGGAQGADQQIFPSFSSSTKNYNITPGANAQNAMNWATGQLDNESRQQQQNQQSPNFYGQQEQLPQQQYVQPQISQQENPYSARAQELNQGNGMGGEVTNYLRKLMGGQPRFGGNSTTGTRG